jgi:hypothetical protein
MTIDPDDLVGYFGFGSLVNRHTLRTDYQDSVPASLKGWRRHWQARSIPLDENIALLSIHPDADCVIQGMLVVDLVRNLPLVDEREAGYSRHQLQPEDLNLPEDFNPPASLYVYVADEPLDQPDDGPLIQSYLDAVMQGFHQVYGEEGVHHFVDTTSQFRRQLIRDREVPKYPRSVTLEPGQAALFDRVLSGVVQ